MTIVREDRILKVSQLNLSNLGLSSSQLNNRIKNACDNIIEESSVISKGKYIDNHEENGSNTMDIITYCDIRIDKLNISHNSIASQLPSILTDPFGCHLTSLNLSDNFITTIDCSIVKLTSLIELNLSSNQLTHKSFPSGFDKVFATRLKVLILSGNRLGMIPCQIYKLKQLESLHLGSNLLESVPGEIGSLSRLKVLYLGGNKLRYLSNHIGQLSKLEALAVCDNQLEYLPTSISKLRNLRSLALHNNNLTTLPQDIIKLNRLIELSLRNNPLVVRFVQDIAKTRVLPLLELSARAIKTNNIQYLNFQQRENKKQLRPLDPVLHSKIAINYDREEPSHSGYQQCIQEPTTSYGSRANSDLPMVLLDYLNSACRCVNPKCKGKRPD